jgi:hypothetical protein
VLILGSLDQSQEHLMTTSSEDHPNGNSADPVRHCHQPRAAEPAGVAVIPDPVAGPAFVVSGDAELDIRVDGHVVWSAGALTASTVDLLLGALESLFARGIATVVLDLDRVHVFDIVAARRLSAAQQSAGQNGHVVHVNGPAWLGAPGFPASA